MVEFKDAFYFGRGMGSKERNKWANGRKELMRCRICDTKMIELEEVKDCRIGTFKILREPSSIATADMFLYQCPSCTHIQTENQMPDTYYDSYEGNDVGFAQYFGELRGFEKHIKKLKGFAPDCNSVLEVGCGNGHFLELLQNEFKDCTGVESSVISSEIGRKRGLHIINDYFSHKLNLKNFSAFASMMVFEHLEQPVQLLKDIYSSLGGGGAGLINVPNGQLILQNGYYHQIVLEHVNYYTPMSLCLLAHKAGLQIIQIDSADDVLELNLYVRKPDKIPGFNETKQKHGIKLEQLLRNKKSISIWGAGPKSYFYSSLLSPNVRIRHVMDKDVRKAGTYINAIPVPVELPALPIIQESDAVIIFASAYNDAIINELRTHYQYQSSIIYFQNNLILEDFIH